MVTEKIEKLAYSPEETAQATGLHVNTIYTLLRSGKMPAIRLKRKFLISKVELEKWLAGNQTPTGTTTP
jgi:excisionase family DNA binding protein